MDGSLRVGVVGGRGRPRSEKARRAILGAAGELLERDGFAAVTIESIAEHAGVSKATIYRWWPNKAAVMTESFLELMAPEASSLDTGSAREDLRLRLRDLAHVLAGRSGRFIAALVAESQTDPEVAEALRTHWIAARRRETRTLLRRGIERGELRPDLDLEVAIDALYGPVYWRMLTGYAPLNDAFVDRLTDHVMAGLSARRQVGASP
jgi:AcrR family transcriptional regulator